MKCSLEEEKTNSKLEELIVTSNLAIWFDHASQVVLVPINQQLKSNILTLSALIGKDVLGCKLEDGLLVIGDESDTGYSEIKVILENEHINAISCILEKKPKRELSRQEANRKRCSSIPYIG